MQYQSLEGFSVLIVFVNECFFVRPVRCDVLCISMYVIRIYIHSHVTVIVPTLLRGEELYTQMGFFLFREFSPLDIFIVES